METETFPHNPLMDAVATCVILNINRKWYGTWWVPVSVVAASSHANGSNFSKRKFSSLSVTFRADDDDDNGGVDGRSRNPPHGMLSDDEVSVLPARCNPDDGKLAAFLELKTTENFNLLASLDSVVGDFEIRNSCKAVTLRNFDVCHCPTPLPQYCVTVLTNVCPVLKSGGVKAENCVLLVPNGAGELNGPTGKTVNHMFEVLTLMARVHGMNESVEVVVNEVTRELLNLHKWDKNLKYLSQVYNQRDSSDQIVIHSLTSLQQEVKKYYRNKMWVGQKYTNKICIMAAAMALGVNIELYNLNGLVMIATTSNSASEVKKFVLIAPSRNFPFYMGLVTEPTLLR